MTSAGTDKPALGPAAHKDGALTPGWLHSSAADSYMLSRLTERALGKFQYSSRDALLRSAAWELKQAGHWRDDVRIDVSLKKGHRISRCMRLLHGVPSPRYWYEGSLQWMAAIDIIYFFAEKSNERRDLLRECLPDLSSFEALEAWLGSFSSRRFHRKLIESLMIDAELKAASYGHRLPKNLVFGQTAIDASEIDRFAWVCGYTSINLAKATPVWTPPQERGARKS